MSLIKLDKEEDFKKFLLDNKNYLIILFFSAKWSDESIFMNNVVEELMKAGGIYQTCKFLQIEAEEFEEISIEHQVDAVPTFVFFRNNKVIQQIVGANASELNKQIIQLLEIKNEPTKLSASSNPEDLNKRLSELVNKSAVTIFMKGSPQEPRCGFSRTTIQILRDQDCKFSYFDILSDNEVREGLKKYSNWPTYPQIYIKGEFIGGLDILKELVENNEFKSLIPAEKEVTLNERLKVLINKSLVMLFMKGNRNNPQCGFSKTMIGLMNETGVEYETFDILQNQEVRAGLKEYSNWPTFPQLYVQGELIGGLDIVKELIEEGEFDSVLKKVSK